MGTDLKYAVRSLLKSRSFTSIAILSLAIGIGGNTAIFSVVHAVLLRPLPYPGAERIVRLTAYNPLMEIDRSNLSGPDFESWRAESHSFEALAAFSTFSTSFRGDAEAERVEGASASADFFKVLGVSPDIGRAFTVEETRAGAAPAVVASRSLWTRRFGGRPEAVGQPLRPGNPAILVGVMPEHFEFPDEVRLWVPLVPNSDTAIRDNRFLEVIGRLKPGASTVQAQTELDAIAARLESEFPQTNRGWKVRVETLQDATVGSVRRSLLVLLAAVGVVLLTACANLANLLLARSNARRREIGIRAALGASRARILRQLLSESVMLALCGGAVGLLVARWSIGVLRALAADSIPRMADVALHPAVLTFAAGLSVLAGVLFGAFPAWHISTAAPGDALKEGGRTGDAPAGRRAQNLLIMAEVALAIVMLSSAALLIRSFNTLQRIDPGFTVAHAVTMRVSLAGPKYRDPAAITAYFETAIDRATAIPGVAAAGAVLSLPLRGGGFYLGRGFVVPGRPHPAEGYNAMHRTVTPSYFRAMGIPITAGRAFTRDDRAGTVPVVIVSAALARARFPGEHPVGQRVWIWRDDREPREIVGVAADVRPGALGDPPEQELYVPAAQDPFSTMTFVIRTTSDPLASVASIRRAVSSADPTQAVYAVKTLEDVFAQSVAPQRLNATLIGLFAAMGLILAAIGVYAVVAHAVGRRRHEMGVRLALGARPADVFALIVRQGLSTVAVGVVVGLGGSLAAGRALAGLLYGVAPSDPATLAGSAAILAVIAAAASALPAWRATRVDPLSALRME